MNRILSLLLTIAFVLSAFLPNLLLKYAYAQEVHLAHAVAGADQDIVDIDGDGSESVTLDGNQSHTHAFGQSVTSWVWKEGATTIATTEIAVVPLNVGIHTIVLTVTDSAGGSAEDTVVVTIRGPTDVAGLAGYYFDFSAASGLNLIPNMNGLKPDWGQIEANLNTPSGSGSFRGTPYSTNFAARFVGLIDIPSAGTYGFALESNDGSRMFIDGNLLINNDGPHGMVKVSASTALTTGKHELMIEYFQGLGGTGLKFYWTPPGSPEAVVPVSVLFHNHATLIPVVNTLNPTFGPLSGGNKVSISGFGFVFKNSQMTVNFGSNPLTGGNIVKVDDYNLEVNAPPSGGGSVTVDVVTSNGISKPKNYLYSDTAPPPIQFITGTLTTPLIDGPTSLAFGPDGKLYVGTQFGDIWVLTLDDNLNVIGSFVSNIIQTSEPNFESILGIAFNPFDFDPANPKVYVAHSFLFHGGAGTYSGKVSILSGPNLSTKTDLIKGLPVSDHDHAVNGMEFSNGGKLYIQIGGETNAGVPSTTMGNLNEGPLSAATLIAHIDRVSFDGNITYDASGNQISGFDVEVFAPGQRNPFDIALHSNGHLYATDNGPNLTFGPESTSCTTQAPDPEAPDELNLIEKGKYYGHPNRYLGATSPSLCVYHSPTEPSTADYTTPLTTFPSSTNGITEYRANTFAGQMRGHLLLGKWNKALFDVTLSTDGKSVVAKQTLSLDGGLDVTVNPFGVILLADNQADKITFHKPDEPIPTNPHIISTFPYRGPLEGGNKLLITGSNLPSSPTVSLGGKDCPVISSTSSKIECKAPAGSIGGGVDVKVTNGLTTAIFSQGYTYLGSAAQWVTKKALLTGLGEVTAASVNGAVYVFAGHTDTGDNNKIYKYNPGDDTWQSNLANQTVAPLSDHAAGQVINGKIYLFGGLSPESNALAIYDPLTNIWSLGASLTKGGLDFKVGSVASAVINGKLYIAGGISGDTTVANTFVYDPLTNSWSELALMPGGGRNHAAGVGYNGKFYVFGGRCCGGNVAGPGTDTVFIYDVATNTWDSTTAQSMPTARGGMGNAVEVNGELIVIGGEGGGPSSGTFPNVEAYNPLSNTWRTLPNLPTPRHGIYPVVLNGAIHVAGGGVSQGFSVSNVHEVYDTGVGGTLPPPTLPTEVRINAGGPNFIDSDGRAWSADINFNTGNENSTTATISGTLNQALYQTERWDPPEIPELEYTVPIANGVYQVTLHFAELTYDFVGARTFNVTMEGNQVLTNLDIFAGVGKNTALTKSFIVTVNDQVLNILLGHVFENPTISAIEVGSPPTTHRINAGGGTFTDALGNQWEADNSFNTGNTSSTASPIGNTADQALYQTERWDPPEIPELEYTKQVANGNYQVNLHFAEIYYNTVGSRVFNVSLEGVPILNNFDILTEVPTNTALIKPFTTTVTDGTLNILFHHVVENPKISAIEIITLNTPSPTIGVTPDPLVFPTTVIATSSASLDVTVSNGGGSDLIISNIALTGTHAADFLFTNAEPYTIPPGGSVIFSGIFTPSATGIRSAQLEFTSNNPAGVKIVNVTGEGVYPSNIRINSGGLSFTDSDGNLWNADAYFNTGNENSTTATISGTLNQSLYQTERWDGTEIPELEYTIPVNNGGHTVNLHFAEIYYNTVGSRVFNVSLEGVPILNNFDILSEVGPNTALVKTFTTVVNDGNLNILFSHLIDNPKISGIEILADVISPTVTITSPADGEVVSGIVPITANATDNVAVAKVEFYVDGVLLSSDTTAPYEASWDTTALAPGSVHNLESKAYDVDGNVGTSNTVNVTIADITAPTTNITSPTTNAFVKGIVTITAAATDDVGVTNVEFYANGVLIGSDSASPYLIGWDTSALPDGQYTLQTKAHDAAGNIGASSLVTVTIDNTAPTVKITQPLNNSIVPRNKTITILADATDNGGVTKVEFLVNGSLKCTDTTSPYSCKWNVPGVRNKQYTITAKAYDKAGNITSTTIIVKSSS